MLGWSLVGRGGACACAAILLFTLGSCRCDGPPRTELTALERCEHGIDTAIAQQTLNAGMRIYYTECAGIHAEPACRKAFHAAASAPVDRALVVASDGCRKAYCPILESASLEICKKDFQATPETLLKAWPPLHQAIIAHDMKSMAPRVTVFLLRFYVRSKQPWPVSSVTGAGSEAEASAP